MLNWQAEGCSLIDAFWTPASVPGLRMPTLTSTPALAPPWTTGKPKRLSEWQRWWSRHACRWSSPCPSLRAPSKFFPNDCHDSSPWGSHKIGLSNLAHPTRWVQVKLPWKLNRIQLCRHVSTTPASTSTKQTTSTPSSALSSQDINWWTFRIGSYPSLPLRYLADATKDKRLLYNLRKWNKLEYEKCSASCSLFKSRNRRFLSNQNKCWMWI